MALEHTARTHAAALAGGLLLTGALLPMHGVAAPCSGTQVTGTGLSDYLTDALICAYEAGTDGSDAAKRWSEQHIGGGTLREYARGASHPLDPSKAVGSWAINGGQVDYSYIGGGSYSFSLYQDGGLYQFCTLGGSPQQVAIVSARVTGVPSGANPCGWGGG